MVVSNVMVSSLDEQQCKTWAHLYHCIIEQEMAIFRACQHIMLIVAVIMVSI